MARCGEKHRTSSATRVPCTIHLFHSPPANPISPGGERRPGDGDDRVFSVPYMLFCLLPLLLIVLCFPKCSAPARINTGLSLFTLALLVVPVMDAVYVKGVPRLYDALDATVAATVMRGVVDALVEGGVIGFAGELPERYMQAVVARTGQEMCTTSATQLHLVRQRLIAEEWEKSALLAALVYHLTVASPGPYCLIPRRPKEV